MTHTRTACRPHHLPTSCCPSHPAEPKKQPRAAVLIPPPGTATLLAQAPGPSTPAEPKQKKGAGEPPPPVHYRGGRGSINTLR